MSLLGRLAVSFVVAFAVGRVLTLAWPIVAFLTLIIAAQLSPWQAPSSTHEDDTPPLDSRLDGAP